MASRHVSKREVYASGSAQERLDALIYHLLQDIPIRLATAQRAIDAKVGRSNFLRRTQGWAIIFASYKDIYSDWVINDRSKNDLMSDNIQAEVMYKYGFLFFYGIGFGAPLLVGLPEDKLDCSSLEFPKLVERYGLSYGVDQQLASGYGSDAHARDISSRINEFDLLVRLEFDCILGKTDDYIEAQEAEFAINELITALNARVALEG